MERNSHEISLELDAKDKEIAESRRSMEEVHQALLDLRRQKIELDVAMSKAKYIYDKLKIERTILANEFWQCKSQGL